ncbi:MAG: hypothetical protein V8T48_05485 [Oscillospiraceae bacterium]
MPSAANHPPIHNCTLKISYRTGGNNQLGPQEKAHQQFRYSAARNRAHRPRIFPDILAYYESEEGQRAFREWLAQREAGQTEGKVEKSK